MKAGQVVIGSDPWMADCIVAPALARLLRKYPKLRFRLRTHGWDELQEDLLARNVDVYVGSPFEADAACRHSHPAPSPCRSPVIICRRESPVDLAAGALYQGRTAVSAAGAETAGMVLCNWLGRAVQYQPCRQSKELHDLFLRAEDLTVIRRIVRETDAVTATPDQHAFRRTSRAVDFAMLHIADLAHIASPGIIATLSDRPVPEATQGFIEEVMVEIESLEARLERSHAPRD